MRGEGGCADNVVKVGRFKGEVHVGKLEILAQVTLKAHLTSLKVFSKPLT